VINETESQDMRPVVCVTAMLARRNGSVLPERQIRLAPTLSKIELKVLVIFFATAPMSLSLFPGVAPATEADPLSDMRHSTKSPDTLHSIDPAKRLSDAVFADSF
jgi:hypothetical protein